MISRKIIGSVSCHFTNQNFAFETEPLINEGFDDLKIGREIERFEFQLDVDE